MDAEVHFAITSMLLLLQLKLLQAKEKPVSLIVEQKKCSAIPFATIFRPKQIEQQVDHRVNGPKKCGALHKELKTSSSKEPE